MEIPAIIDAAKEALGNISFPAHKEEIISEAQAQGSSGEVLEALGKLPDQKFDNADEVIQKLPVGGLGGGIGGMFNE